MSSYNRKKVVFFQESFFFGVFCLVLSFVLFFLFFFLFFFFWNGSFLCPLSIRNTPCLHYFGLYTLGGLSKHVKNVHPFTNLVSQTSHVVLSLQELSSLVFSLLLFLLLLGVSFKLNLVPFWGCLSLGLCALICFIKILKLSKTRLNMTHSQVPG